MAKKYPFRISAVALLSLTASYGAAITQVAFDSGGVVFMKNLNGVTQLTGGSAADGNGAVIQLGYFSAATTGTSLGNFLGVWTPLTGEGSANTGGSIAGSSPAGETFNKTSMGDVGNAGDGDFGITVQFSDAVAGTFNNLPQSTLIPLSIRFYNGVTLASSTFYNTVSNDSWLWKTPATTNPLPPTINMSLGTSAAFKWESVNILAQSASTRGTTSIPVIAAPEPTSAALLIVGLVSLASRRRRVAKV